MLVLTRKEGQQIRIGADIVITLVQTRGNQARIGIDAPTGMNVFRVDAEAEAILARRIEEEDDAMQAVPATASSMGDALL